MSRKSVQAKVKYEQMPWATEGVPRLYRNLSGRLHADGHWHSFPTMLHDIGDYRVYDDSYFQAVFAPRTNNLYDLVKQMAPPEIPDDAEWTVMQHDDDNFSLTSVFCVTPGPFDHLADVFEWLKRHDLGVRPYRGGVQGYASFSEIESGHLRDAIDRLKWLEGVFKELNERLAQTGYGFWQEAKAASDEELSKFGKELAKEEIVPVPTLFKLTGAKWRQPVPLDLDPENDLK